MLLRFQRDRENRRRIHTLRAEQARSLAVSAVTSAREQRDMHAALQAAQLTQAYEALHGRVVDIEALKRIATLEQNLRAKAEELESTFAAAEENARISEVALAEATSMLRLEVRTTHRRKKLASKVLAKSNRTAETAAEVERDDQVVEVYNRQ
jgi:hypothetical protein